MGFSLGVSEPALQMEVTNVETYNKLYETEQKYFVDMVDKCKASGADVVMSQWGFDDEANHLLLQKGALECSGASYAHLLPCALFHA